ncbi:hypothetical protein MLD52_10870 [Puniceicoccaceae bacterium K14]|nr:hypothetical protein [Puniceicoccaceae bacterium K14]
MSSIEYIEKVIEPFPWAPLLSYLNSRLIPHCEFVDGLVYRRITEEGNVTVRYIHSEKHLIVSTPDSPNSKDYLDRIRFLFQYTLDWKPAPQLKDDPILCSKVESIPGFRPLGAWDRFELSVRTIIGQQVTVAAAQTIMQRVVDRCHGEITADNLVKANLEGVGMPGGRVRTLQCLAENVANGEINLSSDWDTLRPRLLMQKGIGPWTVNYLGIRMGRDPDAFPSSDIGLLRATNAQNKYELEQLAEKWKPHRALAAVYLWA